MRKLIAVMLVASFMAFGFGSVYAGQVKKQEKKVTKTEMSRKTVRGTPNKMNMKKETKSRVTKKVMRTKKVVHKGVAHKPAMKKEMKPHAKKEMKMREKKMLSKTERKRMKSGMKPLSHPSHIGVGKKKEPKKGK